ncbi:hypothetical protein OIU79_015860 [Salix purpurea]|uniref:Uncharacterized protein n=1 Tax=Salix purpurea TaxID=77065 RepID=A0A9Q0PCZ0_SALPP|nr:hypothetical protein OIU79_015860 [Salix purpurea]
MKTILKKPVAAQFMDLLSQASGLLPWNGHRTWLIRLVLSVQLISTRSAYYEQDSSGGVGRYSEIVISTSKSKRSKESYFKVSSNGNPKSRYKVPHLNYNSLLGYVI